MILHDQIQGHWIRDWIKTPDFEDHTTHVHWAQCGNTYADVRLPAVRPDVSRVSSLADLSAHQIAQLLQAEGFVGHVTLNGPHCNWHRELNWHGAPDGNDIGHIAFDDTGQMIETGVEATYTELWHHQTDAIKRVFRLSGDGFLGILVIIGSDFVVGIDLPGRPATASLLAKLADGHIPDEVTGLFDGIYATGPWADGVATATLATQPLSEGKVILSFKTGTAIWHRRDFYGKLTQITLDVWTRSA